MSERIVRQDFNPTRVDNGVPRGDKVSIILITCGQLELSRLCLPCLLWHSRPPFEIFVLDIGSIDGTEHYLDGIAAASAFPVEVVHIGENDDLARQFRLVVERSRGEYIVILGNDVLVPPRWLDQMVALAESDQKHGMVGPMSNYAPTRQYTGRPPYRIVPQTLSGARSYVRLGGLPPELSEFCQFSREWRERNRGNWFKTDFLGGFCLLTKRELASHIVMNVQDNALYYFDEKMLSHSILKGGFNLVCCRDLFVHNFGTRKAYVSTGWTESQNDAPVVELYEEGR